MKYHVLFILIWIFISDAVAGLTQSVYYIGALRVSESGSAIILQTKPPIIVSVLPGGKTWPVLALDESGIIYAGNTVIDSSTGRTTSNPEKLLSLPQNTWISEKNNDFQIQQGKRTCVFSLQQLSLDKRRTPRSALKNANILFSNDATTFLALVTQFGQDGKTANYRVEKIDIDACKVATQVNLGNPDLLVELGHSATAGWWMTGTIEQTLLQSSDGAHWIKAALPAGLSGLVSAYVVSAREIWLAASLPTYEPESPFLLVYSADGGRTWRKVVMDDPALRRLPRGWLEGQKRLSQ
jgi:hypothetical protein